MGTSTRRGKPAVAALMLCGCLALDGTNAIFARAQKSVPDSHSKDRGTQNYQQNDETLPTRPRRVDRGNRFDPADGPVIRIGIMIDVTSISISSSPSLIISRSGAGNRDDQKIAVAPVRVEIRQLPAASVSDRPTSNRSNSNWSNSQSRSTEDPNRASNAASNLRARQVVAIASDRVIASSEDSLIVTAADVDGMELPRRDAVAAPRPDLPVRLAGKEYRGEIHLALNRRGKINVINALPLEQYLRGVVPMELSPGHYPAIEALKAQAVAARTYALAHRGRFRDEGYDLRDDARSQVYAGATGEHTMTDRAVDDTRGIVALYPNADGRLAPIEAVYTANCGGRTENNEEVFGGKPLAYLRSVTCSPDRLSLAEHDIVTNRAAESLISAEGRSVAREVALFEVLGFALPRRVTSSYLRAPADSSEIKSWAERAAELAGRDKPESMRGDITRVSGFAWLVASALYGDTRAGLLLTPADVDYILAGLGGKAAPSEARAGAALLLKEGILRLHMEGALDSRSPITRGYAIETIARAFYLQSRMAQANSLGFHISSFKSQMAQAAQNGRLIIAPPVVANKSKLEDKSKLEAAAAKKTSAGEANRYVSREATARKGPAQDRSAEDEPAGLEMDKSAWLFRNLAGDAYAVDTLTIIGGERVIYHLNRAGRVDFIEAAPSERGASSDRFSSVAQWRERVTADDMRRRLSRSRIDVGDIEEISPVAFGTSNRVIEVEIVGVEGRARLRGPRIRNALGLRENLFVVDRELDSRGRVAAFLFTGRGWGHGVGLCQVGAYGLAKDGYSYTAILKKYYTGVKVQKMY
jgi:SpoIID/LytB domain protein